MELGMDEMTKNLWQSIVKSPMTHKPPERKRQDKKHKLVLAAKILVYKKGFSETTLADIAHQADVPLGNVYYYFNSVRLQKDKAPKTIFELPHGAKT